MIEVDKRTSKVVWHKFYSTRLVRNWNHVTAYDTVATFKSRYVVIRFLTFLSLDKVSEFEEDKILENRHFTAGNRSKIPSLARCRFFLSFPGGAAIVPSRVHNTQGNEKETTYHTNVISTNRIHRSMDRVNYSIRTKKRKEAKNTAAFL